MSAAAYPGNVDLFARVWGGGSGGAIDVEQWPPSPRVALTNVRNLTLDSLIYMFSFPFSYT